MTIGTAPGLYPYNSLYTNTATAKVNNSAAMNPSKIPEKQATNPDEVKNPADAHHLRSVKPVKTENIRTALTREMYPSSQLPIFHQSQLPPRFVPMKMSMYPMLTKKHPRKTGKWSMHLCQSIPLSVRNVVVPMCPEVSPIP